MIVPVILAFLKSSNMKNTFYELSTFHSIYSRFLLLLILLMLKTSAWPGTYNLNQSLRSLFIYYNDEFELRP